jgi:aminoglycoside phosphotransferase (APT) family kinase protein
MVRDSPLDEPSTDAVAAAASAVLDADVRDVARIEEGVNAVYRVELADGSLRVLKAATVPTDAEFLPEPVVVERIHRETAIPVPAVRATVPGEQSPLEMAFYVADYCAGRTVDNVLTLDEQVQERLAVESGRYLAALHDLSIGDGAGDSRVQNGEATVESPKPWREYFLELAADRVGKLRGEGPLADDDARFADLAPRVDAAFERFPDGPVSEAEPVLLHGDYRPANLVLTPAADAGGAGNGSVVAAVLDVGAQSGDGLLDLAIAESSLVDLPLGGTARAEALRGALRQAYFAERDVGDARFDRRYPYYCLYTLVKVMGGFDFFVQFAREDNPDAVARRLRSTLDERLAEC